MMKFRYLFIIVFIISCSGFNQNLDDKFIFDLRNQLSAQKKSAEVQNIQGKIVGKSPRVSITISNISLPDFITLMFREVFRRPFVLDRSVEQLNKRIDIEIKKDFSGSAFSAVISVIERFGVDVEDVAGVLIFTVRENDQSPDRIGEKGERNFSKVNKSPGSGSPADCIYYYVPVYSRALDLEKVLSKLIDPAKSIIVVNEVNNSLICKTTLAEQRAIVKLLRSLDVRQKQVAVDVVLAEISLVNSFSGGLETFLNNNLFDFVGDYSQEDGFTLSGRLYLTDVLRTVVSLGQKNGVIRVRSNPYLLVADGSTSSIEVGSEYPILGAIKSSSDSTTETQSIEYRKTGVLLSISPVVSGDDIHLKSIVELSEGQKNESSLIDSPVILSRKIQSQAVLRSGQSLLIGGLVSDSESHSDTFLKIFKTNETFMSTRTELVLMIHVQRVDDDDSWFDRLVEKYNGVTFKR